MQISERVADVASHRVGFIQLDQRIAIRVGFYAGLEKFGGATQVLFFWSK